MLKLDHFKFLTNMMSSSGVQLFRLNTLFLFFQFEFTAHAKNKPRPRKKDLLLMLKFQEEQLNYKR